MLNKDILSEISKEFDKGNVCFQTEEGVIAAPIDVVIKETYNDILLSLGRTFSEISLHASRADNDVDPVYSGVNKTRFINDIAASTIIMALKNKVDELLKENYNQRNYIIQLEKDLSWEMYKNS
jgi:hypothetical protein